MYDLLLPAKASVPDKRLLVKNVHVILFPAETLRMKQDQDGSLSRKAFFFFFLEEDSL